MTNIKSVMLIIILFAGLVGANACGTISGSSANSTPAPASFPMTPSDFDSAFQLDSMVKSQVDEMEEPTKTQVFAVFNLLIPEEDKSIPSDTTLLVYGLWEFNNSAQRWQPLFEKLSPPGLANVDGEFSTLISNKQKVLILYENFNDPPGSQNLTILQYENGHVFPILELNNLQNVKLTFAKEALAVTKPIFAQADQPCCPSKASIDYYYWDGNGFSHGGQDVLPIKDGNLPEPNFRYTPPPETQYPQGQ